MADYIVVPSDVGSVVEAKKALFDRIDAGESFGMSFKGLSKRTLSQNALLHVWLRAYASKLLLKPLKTISEKEVGYMKMTAKRRYYAETQARWILEEKVDLITKETSVGLASSKKWPKGEMFNFMVWLQTYAASRDELILESSGDFEKNFISQTEV
ncbi:hypothetical protein N9F71_00700 [bacterium]|nr:hypothetical protein [bacterium]